MEINQADGGHQYTCSYQLRWNMRS
jgi:hypothetical protein